MQQYWLLKSEPKSFSIEDLIRAPRQSTCWEGVRNYQARNFFRLMKVQDQAFFYHSNGDPPAIVGTVEVVKTAYPDHYSFEPHSRYFDHKSTPEAPRWLMVDIRLMHVFQKPLSLNQLRQTKGLEKMELLRKGSRLSVQPVRPDEWNIIIRVAGKRVATTRG